MVFYPEHGKMSSSGFRTAIPRGEAPAGGTGPRGRPPDAKARILRENGRGERYSNERCCKTSRTKTRGNDTHLERLEAERHALIMREVVAGVAKTR